MYMQEISLFSQHSCTVTRGMTISIFCFLPTCQHGHVDVNHNDCADHSGVIACLTAATEQEHSKTDVVTWACICMHIPLIAASVSISTKGRVLPV